MDDQDTLISVSSVSKRFCRNLRKSLLYGVYDISSEVIGKDRSDAPLRMGEFWANREISFELRKGECLGLIGRNGAGKTTLLKMLNGLIKPDSGEIRMRGRVGALIALGAGFNPILTGRENVFIAGSVLGLTKREIETRYDEIVDFAELSDFMETPVQNYSSGMQVRLGFAVASAMKPDILLIDEVLAVGDAAFRAKCYSRIGKLQDQVATIFVSHSMDQVAQICQKGAFLKKGRIEVLGNVSEAIEAYNQDNAGDANASDAFLHLDPPAKRFEMMPESVEISYGGSVSLRIGLELEQAMPGSTVRITFYDGNGRVAAEWNSKRLGRRIDLTAGRQDFTIDLRDLHLAAGTYRLAFVLNDRTGVHLPVWSYKTHEVRMLGHPGGACAYQLA